MYVALCSYLLFIIQFQIAQLFNTQSISIIKYLFTKKQRLKHYYYYNYDYTIVVYKLASHKAPCCDKLFLQILKKNVLNFFGYR